MEYSFRSIYPGLLLGTASDRYAGWIGQIYLGDYGKLVKEREKRLRDQSFVERVLPVSSVREYFEHFDVLELDYTFYGLLLDEANAPTNVKRTLEAYKAFLRNGDKILVKAPQIITARYIHQKGSYVANEHYLDAALFRERFFEPLRSLLGEHLLGVIFEQEYHGKDKRIATRELVQGLWGFFEEVPEFRGYHLELRTPSYLSDPLFGFLKERGIGLVFSHWTWLPGLKAQFLKAGKEVFNALGVQLIRLMTPRNMRYEDAYKKAFPFDRIRPELLDENMIKDTVWLIKCIGRMGLKTCVIVNNRAGGNAPQIARLIMEGLLGSKTPNPDTGPQVPYSP